MTSSMLTGDRRWASSRRGGMTVLGKVAVPKPINLPSQKLENHGLNPNVEIVPKGTLSWGTKSSTSASNPWGSSSPNATDGIGSPTHPSGRPSSGGSGTRPSTGSSERAPDTAGSAWSSSSRPSSASGPLTSSQTSAVSLRPRSAEPRPGSSQLSRFAESASENSVAWGSAGTAEKLGVTSSKNDGFSLTSGDFPTLGSEKDNGGKNTELQDHSPHGRPGSSSGGVASRKDQFGTSLVGDVSGNENVRSVNSNSWRREGNPYNEDVGRPNVEKWHADPPGPQSYPNAMPPQHYDAWHGPPINNHSGGVWYRGPHAGPPGPPYGSPVPPRGFPMEPFHFYRPQIPPAALANPPQSVPPPGTGPRAHHPKSGDMYRPPMPDAYMCPGMPMRPGFYPGPVPYEGYYGPPMGYRNSNERDMPFMGVAAGPSAYGRYPSHSNAHESGNSQSRPSGYGPNGEGLPMEHVEPGHPVDARGKYEGPLKQHDGWEGRGEEHKLEDPVKANELYVEKRDQSRSSSWENECRGDHRKDEEMSFKRKFHGEKASFSTPDHEGRYFSVPAKVRSPESKGHTKTFDDVSVKMAGHGGNTAPEIAVAPRDSSLIQKIEGLNAKARASDGRHDVLPVPFRDELKNKSQSLNTEPNHSTNDATTGSVFFARNQARINNPVACEAGVSAGDKDFETAGSGPVISRRSAHALHGRTDHRGKGKLNNEEADGWRKNSSGAETTSSISASHAEGSYIQVRGHAADDVPEKSQSYSQGKDEGEPILSMVDTVDNQAQRARMRELAKQRVKQRQKEEEERAREQKAKALAKLEELNRRSQVGEVLTQNSEVSGSTIQNKQEEFKYLADSMVPPASKSGTTTLVLASNVAQLSDSVTSKVEKPPVFSNESLVERPKSAHRESLGMHKMTSEEALTMKHDVKEGDAVHSNASQVSDSGTLKQKRPGYKQRQNITSESCSKEKLITDAASDSVKRNNAEGEANAATSHEVVVIETTAVCDSNLPIDPAVTIESSVNQRKRNNRSGRKQKMEETSSATISSSATSTSLTLAEGNAKHISGDSGEVKSMETEVDPSSVSVLTDYHANQSLEQRLSSPNEENHGRVSNQWKSQHSRRMPRSGQPNNKTTEKFHTGDAVVWAPVRTQNKAEVTGEASQKAVTDSSFAKNDHQVENNLRSKRAEMERYVPKSVAKEMAQQGSNQHLKTVPTADHSISYETVGRTDTGSQGSENVERARFSSGKLGGAAESKNGDGRPVKQGKVHGSWRQRTSTGSTVGQNYQDSQSSNASRNPEKPTEPQPSEKPDVYSGKEQPNYTDDWGDGWNMPESSVSMVPQSVPVAKDQGVVGRGKRHQFKGHRGAGNNQDHDHKKISSGDSDKNHVPHPVPASETSQADIPPASKENRSFGDRSTSHWQPKSQASSSSHQRGNRPNNGQNVGADVVRANKKDSVPESGLPPSQSEKEISRGMSETHQGQSASQTKLEEAQNFGHQEHRRERKTMPAKSHQGSSSVVEATPQNINTQHDQRPSSGHRRNGNQNTRYSRGNESRGDWNSSGQDNNNNNRQHNQPINRERQRQNSHYEYQPVAPHNNNRGNNYEEAKDGPSNTSGRYRERGQSHSRRGGGNFQGRPSGAVRAYGHE